MDYIIKQLDFTDPTDMQKLVDLQNAVYAGQHVFTSNTFKYWYIDNPNGRVVSFNAIAGQVIAAHYALIPIKMSIAGEVKLGLLSMATVTHPAHRGKGLFKTLAKKTYEYAAESGYAFVIGVANANSFPGFIKYFDFKEIAQLEVLIGMDNNIRPEGHKDYTIYWDEAGMKWRSERPNYTQKGNCLFGTKSVWKFKAAPFIKTFMGVVDRELLRKSQIPSSNNWSRPFNLYVGLGSNARKIGYKDVPSFIKHSPFHLIFMDLTGGTLPEMTKDNIFFQLMDFDVA